MRQLLILSPHRLWPVWTNPPNPLEPDRERTFRILATMGYSYQRIDPFRSPVNPFASAHSVLSALDPARALRVLFFHRRADVVFCYYESAALLILLLRRVFFFHAKVVVYDIGVGGSWRLRDIILRRVLPRADMLLPLGYNQTTKLLEMGARPRTIHPVLDATDCDFFSDVEDKPDGYILAVGDDISRDFLTLLKASKGLKYEIVIRSKTSSGADWSNTNVRFIRQRLSAKDYQKMIAGAVLVVLPLHPSTHAGGITTLLEAMSSGRAIVVSNSPGLGDYLQDGKTCYVVPPGDPVALRKAIERLLADHVLRKTLGANARRFVVENCSPQAEAIRFAKALGRLGVSEHFS